MVDGSSSTRFKIDSSGNVCDTKGNLRTIPANQIWGYSGYTAVKSDVGKVISPQGGGVTINNSVFAMGDCLTIVNPDSSAQTITAGSGFTLYNSADAATGNRSLASRGMATIWFASASSGYISGAGLS